MNLVATLLVSAAAALAAFWPVSVVKQTVTLNYPLSRAGTLSVENVSGDIHVQSWSGSSVKIIAYKQAENSDILARLTIVAHSSNGNLSIESIYPRSCSQCDIDYDIQVPRGAALAARTASGDIRTVAIGGGVDVQTLSGDIDIRGTGGTVGAKSASGAITVDGARTLRAKAASGDIKISRVSGDVEASTASGDVSADFATVSDHRSITLSTLNGDVTLVIPRGTPAALLASTVSGSIQSDFGQSPDERYAGASLEQTIGGGSVRIHLTTTSGDIKLLAR